MKRILLHLAISVLAFGLGLTASAFWRFYTVNRFESYIVDEVPSPMLSSLGTELGCRSYATVYSYYLPNGAEISRTCQQFSTAEQANSALQARRRGNYDILEWSATFDSSGRRTGETVLLYSSETSLRLNTYGNTFCETRSSSLGNLHWFKENVEDRFYE